MAKWLNLNYSSLFARAWKLVWRHKFFWALGFLLGVGSISGNLARAWLGATAPRRFLNPGDWLTAPTAASPPPGGALPQVEGLILKAAVILFVVAILFWLIAAMAEGAIIAATLRLEKGQPVTLRQALLAGYRLLGRFIAIDAIVFLPWFAIALLAMILAMAGLLGAMALSLRGATLDTVAGVIGAGAICLAPLLCLLAPAGFLTALFRALAFRESAARNPDIGAGIRHTWRVIRRNVGAVLILALFMWGIRYLANLVLGLVTIPLISLAAVSILKYLSLGVELLAIIPLAIVHAFTAVVWTLAYGEMLNAE